MASTTPDILDSHEPAATAPAAAPASSAPAFHAPKVADFELDKPYLQRGTRLKSFAITSLLSLGCSLVIFLLLVRMDQLDIFFRAVLRAASYFKPVMALIAASPLFFSLLIGYGYMDRAMKRRARQAKEAAARANGS